MRGSKSIVSSAILSLAMWGAADASAATPPAFAKAPAAADCQKLGGEVSALIDSRKSSPNISAARSEFQVGIMECMEGNSVSANGHYLQAKDLLNSPVKKTPTPVAKAPEPIDADCQKSGGEVSALIDTSASSPNIAAARSVFQAGIMQCMEGDDAEANKLYSQAKAILKP
jgi:hypothetical protein